MTREDAAELVNTQLTHLTENPEAWAAWARTLTAFPRYSFQNTLLIFAQRPDATYVAGFQAWKRLGRWVRRGEHGLAILAPMVRRADPDAAPSEPAAAPESSAAEPPARTLYGFRPVTVFAYEQTDGAPLVFPEPRPLTGDQLPGLFEHLVPWVGVPVQIGPLDTAYGMWNPTTGQITVADRSAPDQRLKTLFHEWSHALGVPTPDAAAARHTGTEEVIAETTAYVLAGLCGLDTTAYSQAYVAGWADGHPDTVRAVGQAVTERVHTILGRLTDAIAQDPALAAYLPALGAPQPAAVSA